MTPSEFKEARMLAQLTQAQAGAHCGLTGKHMGRTVRRWELGQCPVPLWAERAILARVESVRVPAILRSQAS